MSRLPRVSGKKLARFLVRMGYRLASVHGSHHKFRSADGRVIIVPIHGNRPIPIGTLHDIVTKRLEMSPEEFRRRLNE